MYPATYSCVSSSTILSRETGSPLGRAASARFRACVASSVGMDTFIGWLFIFAMTKPFESDNLAA